MQAILETQYPAPAARGGEWARAICQGHTWGPGLTQRAVPRYEWMPILNLGKEVVHDNKVRETVTGVSGSRRSAARASAGLSALCERCSVRPSIWF